MTSTNPRKNQPGGFHRFVDKLVFPRFGGRDSETRIRARFVSIGLLVAAVNIGLGALLAPSEMRKWLAIVTPIMILAYVLGRMRHYRIGSAVALAGTFSLTAFIMLNPGMKEAGLLAALMYSTATIFIISFWMAFEWLAGLAAAQMTLIVALSLLAQTGDRLVVLTQWLPLNLLVVILILMVRRLQDRSIRRLLHYQENLEELVALRSRDLREANRQLELKYEKERKLSRNLEQAVDQKDVLLKELYHRTKNNMQVISSLLEIQSASAGGTGAERQFAAARDRIQSMALVHEKLLRSRDLALIDLKEYLRDLAGERIRVYAGESGRVRLDLEGDPVHLSIDQAVLLGLAVNELLTNVLKYAFPRQRSGRIGIRIVEPAGDVEIEIRDDGIGFPAGFDPRAAGGLGFLLVYQIVEGQLGGTFQTISDGGVRSLIRFRIKDSARKEIASAARPAAKEQIHPA